MKTRVALALLFVLLLASRLCHTGIVWVEEAYPSAAAVQMLDGKALYRDIWFDKPPLFPALYVIWGGRVGVPLRIAGAMFIFLCCLALYRFATELWSRREGLAAASLLGFFLTFGIPGAVMALAPDLLFVLPHIAAVYLAWRRKPFWSGVALGAGLLVNPKAIALLPVCALWQYRSIPLLLAGFAAPNVIAIAYLAGAGALRDYQDQVWGWGRLYSAKTFVEQPFHEGALRLLNWAGFHIALVAGAAFAWWKDRNSPWLKFVVWAGFSLGMVALGLRFFPRYFFALLPVMTLAAARAWIVMGRARYVLAVLLLIPLVRFGPQYIRLAGDLLGGVETQWSDTAMNRDSHAASNLVLAMAKGGDTLLVWGYRPDIFAYTRLRAGSRFLDSQPLTGVLADRHLISSEAAAPELAARNRQELTRTRPTFIVDGLGPLNPGLGIGHFEDLRGWLDGYHEVGRTPMCVILRRNEPIP